MATGSKSCVKFGSLRTRSNKRPHILLAEDAPANQMVVRIMLEKAGCYVDVVTNGQEAIDAVRGHRYDALLMDISMASLRPSAFNKSKAAAAICLSLPLQHTQ